MAYRPLHIFGEHDEWAIGADDHCLLILTRQGNTDEWKPTMHIFREAWTEILSLGGYDVCLEKYYKPTPPTLTLVQ